jgi:hypothetical protein
MRRSVPWAGRPCWTVSVSTVLCASSSKPSAAMATIPNAATLRSGTCPCHNSSRACVLRAAAQHIDDRDVNWGGRTLDRPSRSFTPLTYDSNGHISAGSTRDPIRARNRDRGRGEALPATSRTTSIARARWRVIRHASALGHAATRRGRSSTTRSKPSAAAMRRSVAKLEEVPHGHRRRRSESS